MISNGRQPKSCLCRVFSFKLGHFVKLHEKCMSYIESILELKTEPSGLYYKTFRIVIYDRNDTSQYYKTMIVDYHRS
jgi:hypothetical protein